MLQKAVQCNVCDKWVSIASNLNNYRCKKLQRIKSPWYCIGCLQRKLDVLNSFMHEDRILSPNAEFISNVMKQSEYFDEMLE